MSESTASNDAILWSPTNEILQHSQIGRWQHWLSDTKGLEFNGYNEIWEWSVSDMESFWQSIWEYFDILGDRPGDVVLTSHEMPGAEWFPGTLINWAENALRQLPDVAVVARSQTRDPWNLSSVELLDLVARARTGLLRLGVRRGDRVAAYLPNIPEALVVLLASASIGAVFSSCPPEFGVKGVLDRFSRIEPTVLVAVDGYRHRGRDLSRAKELDELVAGLPSLRHTVLVSYLDADASREATTPWRAFVAEKEPLTFERLPFDHPLYILYSSGTSGPPKPIVHGHGGVVIEHTKGLRLHHDLGAGDRFFWFATTGWVMWNYLVSGLLTGASIVMFDGDPQYPDLDTLWQLAAETQVTALGLGAPFLLACRKAELRPAERFDLSQVRALFSTGAPLPAEGFRWVYEAVKDDVFLASISGGTDTCAAFVAGVPILPVTAGEIACRCLGVKVEAFDESGTSVVDVQGELVVTEPMPSMPVKFWGDDDGSRYRASYFEEFPGVWAHGDWITITSRGTCLITGRSDATLNRGGVRLGTSDFYVVVEALPEVIDSLVVHLEDPDGGVGELILFVQLSDGVVFDDALQKRIVNDLRTQLSPRHIPDGIVAVQLISRTLSGKKLEVPVKRILQGMDPTRVASQDSLVEPRALDEYIVLAGERHSN